MNASIRYLITYLGSIDWICQGLALIERLEQRIITLDRFKRGDPLV